MSMVKTSVRGFFKVKVADATKESNAIYGCCQVLVDSGDTEKFCDAKKHFSISGGSFPLVASSTSSFAAPN